MKLNGLEKYFKTNEGGEIVDFIQISEDGMSPLLYAFALNKYKNLNLSVEQFDYLIKNSDLKHLNKYAETPLLYAFIFNKGQNLNLSHYQFDYLIQNSDLTQVSEIGWSALMYALEYNKSQNLNLNQQLWKYLIENSDLSLIKDKEDLIELKKIQSELLNDDILNKIDITKDSNKKVKI